MYRMVRVSCFGTALALLCLLLVGELILSQKCGKRKVVDFLILNGNETREGDFPWHVAIFHNTDRSYAYQCGGTILDQNTVLTAAHCVMTSNGIIARKRVLVHVGRNRLSAASQRVQEHEAFQLIVHPEFNVNRIQHDIALVTLATDITYTDYIQPICLWNRGEDQNTIIGSYGTLIGFGLDETDKVSDTLREASIPVVSHITCIESNRALRLQLTSNMFCAGNRDGISACNGDSGGGLFYKYNDVWFIRGVVSFTKPREHGTNCDTKAFTVFTDVAKYLKWIEQHIPGISGGQASVKENDNSLKIKLLPISTCGANPHDGKKELSKPVILGYPWVGLVECTRTEPPALLYMCHAILISDRYLIITSSCGKEISECSQTSVRLGEYDRSTMTDCSEVDGEIICSPPVQVISIESVIMHKMYRSYWIGNDIALIRLRNRADTSRSNVKPICLPVTSELRRPKSSIYILTAWYREMAANIYPTLDRSLREVIELDECIKMVNSVPGEFNISTSQICVKPDPVTLKVEVTSAPLQLIQRLQGASRYVLHGISSYVWKYRSTSIEVYTNVANYVDWILQNIQE